MTSKEAQNKAFLIARKLGLPAPAARASAKAFIQDISRRSDEDEDDSPFTTVKLISDEKIIIETQGGELTARRSLRRLVEGGKIKGDWDLSLESEIGSISRFTCRPAASTTTETPSPKSKPKPKDYKERFKNMTQAEQKSFLKRIKKLV